MKLTRKYLRKLINEAIEDLGRYDQSKVAMALATLPGHHQEMVKLFLNDTLEITADEFNAIEADEELMAEIEMAVKVYREDNDIDNLISALSEILADYVGT
jgi:selenocysteine lyase/cysteine desulfurase